MNENQSQLGKKKKIDADGPLWRPLKGAEG